MIEGEGFFLGVGLVMDGGSIWLVGLFSGAHRRRILVLWGSSTSSGTFRLMARELNTFTRETSVIWVRVFWFEGEGMGELGLLGGLFPAIRALGSTKWFKEMVFGLSGVQLRSNDGLYLWSGLDEGLI